MPEETDRTKQALDGALRRLLAEKPLDQIRVRELTERCGLRRQSFYYHFADVYQLFDWSIRRERSALPQRQAACLTWQQAVEDLLRRGVEERDFFLAVLSVRGREGLEEMVSDAVEQLLRRTLDYYRSRRGAPPDREAEEARVAWGKRLVLTLLEDALQNRLPQPPEATLRIMEEDLRRALNGAAWEHLPRNLE